MVTSRQLSFADVRPRGPKIVVLPDAARVEERLLAAARAQGFVAGRPACSVAELERELVREARRAGKCPAAASPEALALAVRQAARDHSPGPFFRIREQAGYARGLQELLATLTQGLLDPAELLELDVPERVAALVRTLSAARRTLDRAGLVEPHRAVRIAVEEIERGLPLPAWLARAGELELDAILDWTPLRLRLASALSARMRVRIRLPWAPERPQLTEALEPALRALERLGGGPAPEVDSLRSRERAAAAVPAPALRPRRGPPSRGRSSWSRARRLRRRRARWRGGARRCSLRERRRSRLPSPRARSRAGWRRSCRPRSTGSASPGASGADVRPCRRRRCGSRCPCWSWSSRSSRAKP